MGLRPIHISHEFYFHSQYISQSIVKAFLLPTSCQFTIQVSRYQSYSRDSKSALGLCRTFESSDSGISTFSSVPYTLSTLLYGSWNRVTGATSSLIFSSLLKKSKHAILTPTTFQPTREKSHAITPRSNTLTNNNVRPNVKFFYPSTQNFTREIERNVEKIIIGSQSYFFDFWKIKSRASTVFIFSSHKEYVKRESNVIAWVEKKFSSFDECSYFLS